MAQKLIDLGANANTSDKNDNTPQGIASKNENTEIIPLLEKAIASDKN